MGAIRAALRLCRERYREGHHLDPGRLSYQPPFLEAYNQTNATPHLSQQVDLRRARYPRMTVADPYGSAGVQNAFPAGYAPKTPDSSTPIVTPVVAVTYATDWRPPQVWTSNLTNRAPTREGSRAAHQICGVERHAPRHQYRSECGH